MSQDVQNVCAVTKGGTILNILPDHGTVQFFYKQEEHFPFVRKTSENFPPNGTVHFFTDKPCISSLIKEHSVGVKIQVVC